MHILHSCHSSKRINNDKGRGWGPVVALACAHSIYTRIAQYNTLGVVHGTPYKVYGMRLWSMVRGAWYDVVCLI